MKSKHDMDLLVCNKCQGRFSDKELFLSHEKQCCANPDRGSKPVGFVHTKVIQRANNFDKTTGRSDTWSDRTDGISTIPSPTSSLNL